MQTRIFYVGVSFFCYDFRKHKRRYLSQLHTRFVLKIFVTVYVHQNDALTRRL